METVGVIGTSSSRKTLMGLLIGLAVPLVIILLINYFDDTIKSRDDVEKNTRLPIVGNVIHSDHESPLPVVEFPRSSLAESYRSIRTNLQYMLSSNSHKVIAIQSTSPEEGKSFTAINLACILAMNNNKVLLVGCDLRKPKIQKIFDNHNKQGLSTYLIGNNTFEEILDETGVENLWMVPSGPIPPNPAELLGKQELKKFITEASDKFDYIVMDNAPISMVTDGLLTGKLADLNLFILRADTSHKQMIKLINQLAEKNTLSHISLIINDIKAHRLGYKYSYHSGYHYSHYYSRYGKGYYTDEEKLTRWQKIWKKARKRYRHFKKLMNPKKW
jgi:capsular exopolysaccharide synthesis family protein